jgi:hypothetical protein
MSMTICGSRRSHASASAVISVHIVTYCVVNAMLVGIWAISGGGYFWPAWVLLGWGVGLVLNVWDVYFRRPVTEHDIQQEIERLLG